MSKPLLIDNIESRILRGGDKMTGALHLKGAPTADLEAATKKYVDDNTPDTANAAKKLAQARNLAVSDNDGSNTGPTTAFDGTANATMKLPATIKASLNGNASSASKLTTSNIGDGTKPVYFENGVPKECGTSLAVSITGNAKTADQADEATHSAEADHATNADLATNATEADHAAEATTATTCTGNAATATKLASAAAVGSTTKPVFFSGGQPSACGSTLDVDISGKATTADKLNTNAGSTTLPVYFDNGIPKDCGTSLAVSVTGSSASCTGNAATSDQLKTARNFSIADNDGTNTGPVASFNGSANTIINLPATIKASLSGNASTATKLATARTISLTGDVTGSGSFDGSGNLSITATVADNSHNHNYVPYTASGISDLNTMTNSGFYRVDSSLTNSPTSGDWGQVLVIHGGGDTITQIHGNYSNGNLFTRSGNPPDIGGSGTWTSWKQIWISGNSVTGAVWNDYAECREADTIEPGYILIENGDDTLSKSTERLQPFAGVSSDTWGFSQGETEKAKTPIAVAGRVLVYPYEDRNSYQPGDCVCAAADGKVSKMTREEVTLYPDRIVGTVSCVPAYEKWGGGEMADRDPVDVNGRIWIKVK